ncbi:hypothetical protein DFQ26_002547 [Actinomortierella ambigua]|nr:hypothetical protein DFQ26_002547 [Actinomortierella ambigua]
MMRNRSPPSSLTPSKVVWALVAGMIACSTCASALPTELLNPKSTHGDLQQDQIDQASSSLGPARMSGKIILSDVKAPDEDDTENDDNYNGNENHGYKYNHSYTDGEGDSDDDNDDRRYKEMTALSRQTHPSHRYALQRSSILDDPIPAAAQVLHQCTTHFSGLLQAEVSDHLVVKLSRFVQMLPLLGDDIKTVLVDEVDTILDQILQGLVRYDNIHRVIKMAVDDSGLLLLAGSGRGAVSGDMDTNVQNVAEDDDYAIEQELQDDSDDNERAAYSRYHSLFKGADENEEEESSQVGGGGGRTEEELSAQLWSYDDVSQDPYEKEEEGEEREEGGRDSGDSSSPLASPPRRFWTDLATRWRSTDGSSLLDDPSTAVLARIEPLASQRYYRANRNKVEVRDYEEDDEATTSNEDINADIEGADVQEGQIDESQIPVIAEVAMDAVVDYAAEVLHPTLVIHEISNALQRALRAMKKSRRLRQQQQQELESDRKNGGFEDGDESDLLLMADEKSYRYGDNRLAKSDHELDLLGDEWVWSEGEADEDQGTEANDDQIDEDLWDQELEVQDWDETGRLFEMEEDELEPVAATASTVTDATTSATDEPVITEPESDEPASAEPDDLWLTEDERSHYPVGIQDDDEGNEDDDDNNDIDGADADQEYTSLSSIDGDNNNRRGSYLGRGLFEGTFAADNDIYGDEDENGSTLFPGLRRRFLQKRSYIPSQDPLLVPPVEVAVPPSTPPSSQRHKSSLPATAESSLEGLLSQLMEPILNNFINHDFPASCQSSQGELMDAIIWSLDQKDDDVEADQLALFAELEY